MRRSKDQYFYTPFQNFRISEFLNFGPRIITIRKWLDLNQRYLIWQISALPSYATFSFKFELKLKKSLVEFGWVRDFSFSTRGVDPLHSSEQSILSQSRLPFPPYWDLKFKNWHFRFYIFYFISYIITYISNFYKL